MHRHDPVDRRQQRHNATGGGAGGPGTRLAMQDLVAPMGVDTADPLDGLWRRRVFQRGGNLKQFELWSGHGSQTLAFADL